jgi:ASPIC and UnbV/FG-GAP-like repeat
MKIFGYIFILTVLVCLVSCNKKHTLFQPVVSSQSGIHFNNEIVENDSINPLNLVNMYNGGGVGIGDFNNDGLQDIYFAGNRVACRLYLNKGSLLAAEAGFKFDDVTSKAGVDGLGRWVKGVAVVDINNDGLMDIYLCNTIYKDSMRRQNILYINQGLDKEGIPHFKDMAHEYGLDVHVQSTMASFFDYDNDGDLDMYLAVNEATEEGNPNTFVSQRDTITAKSVGQLFRNDWDSTLKHPLFTDVSKAAGMIYEGYGHAATICDINNDGWKDIYVSDDFLSSNLLYVNNRNGTFTDRSKDYFKHTCYNAMGQDVVDINNDGLPDVIELDMNPEDNYRRKMMLASNSYLTYQNLGFNGYQYQYMRNQLQLNQGVSVGQNDSIGIPAFSEIGFMGGISQTDWSWSPVVQDFDNDSYRDMIVTNGFPRDVTDHDFMLFRNKEINAIARQLLQQIPSVKLHNYAFRNKADLTFSNETVDWGFELPTFSSGAAYADFDNDGDLDVVINNTNDEALLYRNTTRIKDTAANHFLQIKFKGDQQNINGLGAIACIYYDHDKQQVYDNNPYRGYLSSMQGIAHFGLGKTNLLDSVVIKWYNGKKQTLQHVKANQTLTVKITDAAEAYSWQQPAVATSTIFKEVTAAAGISYKHFQPDVIDFDIQPMLPHKLSEYSPAAAVGDMDGNGFDDLLIGGNKFKLPQLLLQQPDGKFLQKDFLQNNDQVIPFYDEGILIFDANGDGRQDVYIASGGYKEKAGSPNYQDRLYINDGKGGFKKDSLALPVNHTSKLCVRAADFNNDGKPDVFVSGRVEPWKYPKPVSSFIFRNDSDKDHVKFTDVTFEVAPDLKNIGLICDALFTDFDGDGQTDLIVVGEWMPVTFLKNTGGKFKNVTAASGSAGKTGWWNSITAGDFRHTGKTDYIIGNTGLNTFYKASDEYPVYVTAKDFDNTGSYIAIPSVFLPDEHGVKKEFPAMGRDDAAQQLPGIKKRFATYRPFALATMDEVLTPEQKKDAQRVTANTLQSCYFKNDGAGKFTMIPLPLQAQISVINGMVVDDFDGDGNLDVLINGNDYGIEAATGRYDAMNGLLLKGDGKGDFKPLSILQSGIYIPGNGKALVKLLSPSGDYLVAASQHNDKLKLFQLKKRVKSVKANPDDVSAVIKFNDGSIQKEELYYGNSFLSQSGRFFSIGENVAEIQITNSKGSSRKISFSK